MLVIVSYDISTVDALGRKRLKKISKLCLKYGQRVQNSVFECQIDSTQKINLRNELLELIDLKEDSLRIYTLGNKYKNKIEHYGAKPVRDLSSDTIII